MAGQFDGQRVGQMREPSRLQIAQTEFLKGIMQMLPETLYPFATHVFYNLSRLLGTGVCGKGSTYCIF